MADVSSNLKDWSTTAATNNPSGATTIGAGLDDNLREIQACVRGDLATKGADIASSGTTDLGAVQGLMHDITGTTTITSFGTVAAGIWKLIKFEGALTLTHNATSLILPNAANITTADGDTALLMSEGSGNWRIHAYAGKNAYFSTVTTSGAATIGGTLTLNTGVVPDANDGAYLGQSGTAFSDLFLASGAVINFNAGNYTITHAAGTLTFSGNGSFTGNVGIGVAAQATRSLQVTRSAAGEAVLGINHSDAGGNNYGVSLVFDGSPDNNTNYFFRMEDGTTARNIIYSDGDILNHDGTYGTISDLRFKPQQSIRKANSQLSDVRQLAAAMINYETIFSPGKKLLGWGAQDVQQISPGCVHVCKWGEYDDALFTDDMTILKKGFRALGELIEKDEADDNYYRGEIQSLRAEVAALKAKP